MSIFPSFKFDWQVMSTIVIIDLFLTGCSNVLPNGEDGVISYAETSNGELYFTNLNGELLKMDRKGNLRQVSEENHGFVIDVDMSPNGDYLAVAERGDVASKPNQVVLYKRDASNGFKEQMRVDGQIPRFTRDGSALYFCEPKKYSPRIGFGGGMWTEYELYSVQLGTKEIRKVSGKPIWSINDISVAGADSNIYLSVREFDGNSAFERIRLIDSGTGGIESNVTTEGGWSCNGDPDISVDQRRLVFVSDRQQAFHYRIYVKDLDTNNEALVEKSDLFRFASHPSFSRSQPNSILALVASDFDVSGRPKLVLVRFSDGEVNNLVSNSVLSGSR